MIQYLDRHKLLSWQQHGFLAKRSTLTNLLGCLSDWTLALDNLLLHTLITPKRLIWFRIVSYFIN